MLNSVILMGRLVADPELRQTPNGISVCSFRVAVERNYQSGDKKQADFINIVAWRQTAEFICNYFAKGRMIALQGSIQTRSYEDRNGNKRTAVEVVTERAYFADSKTDKDSAPAVAAPPVSYSSGEPCDFSDEPRDFSDDSYDSDDLPF